MKFVTPRSLELGVMPDEAAPVLASSASPAAGAAPAPTVAMAYTQGLRGYSNQHELMTRMEVVRRLAALKGLRDVAEGSAPAGEGIYYVPSDTLVGVERAAALGIFNREHLFGGVVPHPFVSTKAITHGLVRPDARAPEGWCHEFADKMKDSVLRGYTAFTRDDAREAGRRMLALGDARVKTVRETGGRGQIVVRSEAELEACLAGISDETLAADGLVIEENLRDVVTLSVGQVSVGGQVATYHGTQRLVTNHSGAEVYGGSRLTVVRGDFHALLAMPLDGDVRLAVEQAMQYDVAAMSCFPGFFASRINYDIAQGIGPEGEWRSGVLEQSWRAGGATGAEIAALEAFRADPEREVVTAECVEVYGECDVPEGAVVYFRGVDPKAGQLTKYTIVEPHAHTP